MDSRASEKIIVAFTFFILLGFKVFHCPQNIAFYMVWLSNLLWP